MKYLLDTNVVSQYASPKPELRITQWLDSLDEDGVFISVITLAEIQDGVERMPIGKRRERLDEWLAFDLPIKFSGRILQVDPCIATECGRVMARQYKAGRADDAMDAFIAATALCHNLTLVTRNTADFHNLGLHLINPWIDQAP